MLLGHGSGGQLSAALMRDVIAPALGVRVPGRAAQRRRGRWSVGAARLAFTTDSFVVSPLVFPGGDIGELAVNGTVNDLAMMGARPVALSLAYVIEEGLPFEELRRITRVGGARGARGGGADRDGRHEGRGAGRGGRRVREHRGHRRGGAGGGRSAPTAPRPGDVVVLSGAIGLHGVAIMSVREGLDFEVEIKSDTQPLAGLVAAVLAVAPDAHVLRDPTRGGLSSALNEIAAASGVGITLDEPSVPIPGPCAPRARCWAWTRCTWPTRASASRSCPPPRADAVVAAMRSRAGGGGRRGHRAGRGRPSRAW